LLVLKLNAVNGLIININYVILCFSDEDVDDVDRSYHKGI